MSNQVTNTVLALQEILKREDLRPIRIDYTNYKGERAWRRIFPRRMFYGHTEFHQEEQYLLDAFDVDKGVDRTFAVADIHEIRMGGEDG